MKLVFSLFGLSVNRPQCTFYQNASRNCIQNVTIIDCTQLFTETPSSVEAHNLLWNDYKYHTTIKILVFITPNGAISWAPKACGGRTSDVHIVRTSGFLKITEPYDQIMTDRGFHQVQPVGHK